MSLLEAALQYAEKGQAVFPCHYPKDGGCSCGNPACDKVAKHPMTKNGLRDASKDYTQIREWWEKWPEANIGLTCQGFDVLDVDGPDSLAGARGLPQGGPLVKTPRGGSHYYMKPTPGAKAKVGFLPGLDFRADGKSYVLAPPSRTLDGDYTWVRRAKLPDCPDWIPPMVKNGERREIPETIEKGQRNDTLMSLAGKARYVGLSEAEILAVLRSINDHRVSPKEEDRVLVDMASRASKFEPGALFAPQPKGDVEARSGWIGDFEGILPPGISTGIELIDANTKTGGFTNGQVSIIQAQKGGGKTMTMLQSARHQLQQGRAVMWITLADLSVDHILDRLVQMETGWPFAHEPQDEPMRSEWHEAKTRVKGYNLWVHDVTQHRSLRYVDELAKFVSDNHHVVSLVYVDYAQRLRAQGLRSSYDIAEEASDTVSWLARDIDKPLAVGSQESFTADGGYATKGGKAWEEDAGLVLRISWVDDKTKTKLGFPYDGIKDLAAWEVTKNRFGEDRVKEFIQLDRKHITWVPL